MACAPTMWPLCLLVHMITSHNAKKKKKEKEKKERTVFILFLADLEASSLYGTTIRKKVAIVLFPCWIYFFCHWCRLHF